MQVLEGEEEPVRTIYARITQDPRHLGILTLLQGPIDQPTFFDWSMGFRDLDSAEVKNTPGYNEYLNDEWLGSVMQANPSRAALLLQVFRQGMR